MWELSEPVSLKNDPNKLLNEASEALAAGQLPKSVAICKILNSEFPNFAPGWAVASRVALRLGNAEKAIEFIDRALAIEPGGAHLHIFRAQALLETRDLDGAVNAALQAPKLSPNDAAVLYNCGTFLGMHCHRHELACPYYERACLLSPTNAEYQFSLAAVYRFLGKAGEASTTWDKAIELKPEYYEAYLLRSEVRKQSTNSNHIPELEGLMDRGVKDWRGETMICHALAKEYEDIFDFKSSFSWLKRGCDLRQQHTRYDVEADEKTMLEIERAFPRDVIEQSRGSCDIDEPIFVLGLPRTGSTLLERILSSHDQVYAAGELNVFALELVRQCQEKAGTNTIARDDLVKISATVDFTKLGHAYIRGTRPATEKQPRFIDKMPNNFLYCGLIKMALPQAKIVHITRNPMDSCFAMYKRLFKNAYPMSYDLAHLGRYYIAYRRLMTHWKLAMPGTILEVSYEQLVDEQEQQTRRLLDYCDLDWQDSCMRFEKNAAPSTTASASQVREPIYRSSRNMWRNYEDQLQPLRTVLEDAGIAI